MLRLTLILSLVCTFASAQKTLRVQAYACAFKPTGHDAVENECNILIIMNYDKRRLTVYSKAENYYDIISSAKKYFPESRTEIVAYDAVDKSDRRCLIRAFYRSQDDNLQLQIEYPEVTYIYAIKEKD